MPRWKKDAKEFEVAVNFEEKRGYQSYIPKPVMLMLQNPRTIKYVVKGSRIEITGGEPEQTPTPAMLMMQAPHKSTRKVAPKTRPSPRRKHHQSSPR